MNRRKKQQQPQGIKFNDQERICFYDRCGITFTPTVWFQRFHTNDCRAAYWKERYKTVRVKE